MQKEQKEKPVTKLSPGDILKSGNYFYEVSSNKKASDNTEYILCVKLINVMADMERCLNGKEGFQVFRCRIKTTKETNEIEYLPREMFSWESDIKEFDM